MSTSSPAQRWLRIIAPVEAVSYVVLIGALVGRLVADGPDLRGVLGPFHGVIVLVYLGVAARARVEQGWPNELFLRVVAATIVPGGGFWVARRLDAGL